MSCGGRRLNKPHLTGLRVPHHDAGSPPYPAGVSDDPRVLIDATAVPADRGGVGRYVDSLVAALDADGARVTVVCQPRDLQLYDRLAPSSRVVPASPTTTTR